MSLKIRFRFDGKCSMHPRYNPERDGGPEHKECSGCESLRVIQLYVSIARKKAESAEGLVVFRPEALALSEAPDTASRNPAPDTEQQDAESEEPNLRVSD
jgi:hypothetical protein